MRNFVITAAILAIAAPLAGAAQPYRDQDRADQWRTDQWQADHRDHDRVDRGNFWRDAPGSAWDRISWIQQRIERGRADGTLTGREYWRSAQELRSIRQIAWRLRERDGGRLTVTDASYVQDRLDRLSQQVRWDRRDHD
ncbi:MAG: hypothetical protein KGN34_02530 [Sphingomonadales bacterium]|nr:hypothetical protein [Sphingomonadales bacterium]